MPDMKQACQHLRNILRYRLMAWDESAIAERMLDCDVDTASDSVEHAIAGIEQPDDVDRLTDTELLEIFDVKPGPDAQV